MKTNEISITNKQYRILRLLDDETFIPEKHEDILVTLSKKGLIETKGTKHAVTKKGKHLIRLFSEA